MLFRSWSDTKGVITTVSLTVLLVALGIFSFRKVWPSYNSGWIIWLGLAAGGLGGILHEFAQSGGKLVMTKREADGIYLGSLTGMLLGIIAGVLAVQGLFSAMPLRTVPGQSSAVNPSSLAVSTTQSPGNSATSVPQPPVAIQALYTALLAGLGLKGVAEAVTGQSVSSKSGPLPANARIPIDLPATPQPPKLS